MKTIKCLTGLSRLPLYAAALLPMTAAAQFGLPLQGSISVSAEASPNTTGATFCGGSPADQLVIEAHGTGFSTFGAFTATLRKTFNFGTGEYHGCLVLTAPNGDTLSANYHLSQPNSASDFSSASGTLVITGGTGRFKGATGTLKATGVFLTLYPASSFLGGTMAPVQVAANYVIDGTVSFAAGFFK
jgi:hypothetical protein